MKFVVMFRDECGYDCRAYGDEFLEKIHEFPDFDTDDDAMHQAFITWVWNVEEKAQALWDERHAPGECTLFLEREYEDCFKHMGSAIYNPFYNSDVY